jgi:nitrogen regulatory protein PII
MAKLIVCVLDDRSKTEDVLRAWVDHGVPGVTILDSRGLGHHYEGLGCSDDIPLFPSLETIMRQREEPHHTLLVVVDDDFPVQRLVDAAESIVGPFGEEDTGILLVLPVLESCGIRPGCPEDAETEGL